MTKRFNIPGFGFSAILSMPASGGMISNRMTKTDSYHKARLTSRNLVRLIAVVAAIALLIAGCYYYSQRTAPLPPIAVQTSGNYITNDQLEAQYGVRVTLIAVTAVGGIVDFRYKVTDPTKAGALLHDPANSPTLTAVDSGLTLSGTQMSRHHSQRGMKRGAVPFTFFPNVRGAVKPGTLVSVAFGKIKVEPIAAQ